jgi:hypothetical protein
MDEESIIGTGIPPKMIIPRGNYQLMVKESTRRIIIPRGNYQLMDDESTRGV